MRFGSNERPPLHVPKLVKRSLAILSLSLALCNSALADERGFTQALGEWQALFRPLNTARGSALPPAVNAIIREHPRHFQAIEDQSDSKVKGWHHRKWAVVEATLKEIESAYAAATPQGQRALARLCALLGDRFGGEDVPQRGGCIVVSDSLEEASQALLRKWVQANRNAFLGLLDDPDPRIAESAVALLSDDHRETVSTRLERWRHHPQARFRGIVVFWSGLLGEDEGAAVQQAFLDDPSNDVRNYAIATLPYSIAKAELAARRGGFAKGTWTQRKAILLLAHRVEAPDLPRLALPFLNSADPTLRLFGVECLNFRDGAAQVPPETLARLRRDSNVAIRRSAYTWSGLSRQPMKDLRKGLEDPDALVRETAFEACCTGAESLEELQHLVKHVQIANREAKRIKARSNSEDFGEQTSAFNVQYRVECQEGFLREAFGRLSAQATSEALRLLDSQVPEERRLGTFLACGMPAPSLLALLMDRANDPHLPVRECLVRDAAKLSKPAAFAILTRLRTDADAVIGKRAEAALKELESADR